jgi:hypothetical protein
MARISPSEVNAVAGAEGAVSSGETGSVAGAAVVAGVVGLFPGTGGVSVVCAKTDDANRVATAAEQNTDERITGGREPFLRSAVSR